MTTRRKRVGMIALATLLMMALTISCTLFARELRCGLVAWSSLKPVNDRLYVDPVMGHGDILRLGALLAEATSRDALLYGALRSEPVVIAGLDERVIEEFGGRGNRRGATHFLLGRSYVVLGPDGMNIDVIAHELMHAELAARLGWWTRDTKIPAWFDEGLAMQADNRPDFSEEEWRKGTKNGTEGPRLADMTSERAFATEDAWLAFVIARHEVKRWLDIVGRDGLDEFLRRMDRGDDFDEAYAAVEREHR